MDNIQETSRTADDLKSEAERRLAARLSLLSNPVDESALPRMLFEISLREVEFETQNAALRQSRDENEEARRRAVEAEAALKASEARYRELLENIPDIVWSMNTFGRFTFISPQARALLGFEPEEILRFGVGEWRVRVHPEDRDRMWQASQALLEEGREYTEEFRFLHKDNHWIWVQAHARISHGTHNEFRIDGLLIDITREREMQEQLGRFSEDLARQLKEQREQVERLERRRSAMDKLAAIGRVAAAIAHEVNSPLAGIRSSFQLIRSAIPADHPHFSYVPLIEKELARVTDIVRQMYLLYQPSECRVHTCDPAVAAREVVQILSSTFSARGVAVKLQIDPETCKANINEGELKQVIYNILHNALRVSPEGANVTLTMSQHAEQPLLTVTDQGPGIAPEILPYIFEPFFTGRSKDEPGENMGIGLSVSWSLVSNVGGWIEVESEPGKGTTFKIFLPVA